MGSALSGSGERRWAVLLDLANFAIGLERTGRPFDAGRLVDVLKREKGELVLREAYGDFDRYAALGTALRERGFGLSHLPRLTKGSEKNHADIQMVVDAMRVAFTSPHIDAFVLLSGDSDLLPLVQELIRMGKRVDVVAVAGSASAALAANCHQFDTYEDLLTTAPTEPAGSPTGNGAGSAPGPGGAEGAGDSNTAPATLDQALHFLRQSVLEMQDRGSNTLDSTVYDYLRLLNPAFSVRALGFRRWRDFLDRAAELGVVHVESRASNLVVTPGPPPQQATPSGVLRRSRLGRIRRTTP
ncbi:MAG TPA: NYN domain-containing protein [Ktedonobacterales bacterium]|nr:NYN domain-containing protein [Ktedonobacterales bacterium]